MIEIKKTKSVLMEGDKNEVDITIGYKSISIPAKSAFQVLRGLISYTQKFYRKHIKSS
jgi:hypothetical protein